LSLKAFKRALWAYHLNTGSCNGCDIEILAVLTPRYDVERFGIMLVGSPRRVKRIYEQTPDPKLVVVVGSCGIEGGVFYESYSLAGPVDQIIPVDVYVPGCPPRPEAIIEAVVKAWVKLEKAEQGVR
jgi:membrane-bound hydrogenase subunit mbhJ